MNLQANAPSKELTHYQILELCKAVNSNIEFKVKFDQVGEYSTKQSKFRH